MCRGATQNSALLRLEPCCPSDLSQYIFGKMPRQLSAQFLSSCPQIASWLHSLSVSRRSPTKTRHATTISSSAHHVLQAVVKMMLLLQFTIPGSSPNKTSFSPNKTSSSPNKTSFSPRRRERQLEKCGRGGKIEVEIPSPSNSLDLSTASSASSSASSVHKRSTPKVMLVHSPQGWVVQQDFRPEMDNTVSG